MTAHPKPRTFRSKRYLAYIRQQSCLACGNPRTVPHHEGLGKAGKGIKAPDSHALPLCHMCHMRRHQHGADRIWGHKDDAKQEIVHYLKQYIGMTQNVDVLMLIVEFLTEQIDAQEA